MKKLMIVSMLLLCVSCAAAVPEMTVTEAKVEQENPLLNLLSVLIDQMDEGVTSVIEIQGFKSNNGIEEIFSINLIKRIKIDSEETEETGEIY